MNESQNEPLEETRLSRIRNVGIIAHIDAGKTTLTERILFETDEIRIMGDVPDGTTVTDWMQQERERGVSIVAAAVTCHWRQCQINIVDTPGHIDFTAEVERSLCVLDGVIAVFCAVRGVQAQSETVWRRAQSYRLPALAFINKMDRLGADPWKVVGQMQDTLGIEVMPVQFPIGAGSGWQGTLDLLSCQWNGPADEPDLRPYQAEIQKARERLIEALADVDEQVMQCYVDGVEPAADALRRALRKAVIRRRLLPVFFGSSLHNVGVKKLLDGICLYLPSPLEHKVLQDRDFKGGASALVFRVSRQGEQNLAFVRVLSGLVRQGTELKNARNAVLYRVDGVFRVWAAQFIPQDGAIQGDIVAISGNLSRLRTGDVLVPRAIEAKPPKLHFPQPVVSMLLEACDGKAAELASALKLMASEDPTLRIRQDAATASWQVSGMGEFHLEVLRENLRLNFGINTLAGKPRVEYVETVQGQAQAGAAFEKRLYDGRQLKAKVELNVAPLARGAGIRLDFSALEGKLSKAGEQAVRQGIASIVNADSSGCPLTDLIVKVTSASSDAGEASEVSLLNAARMAMGKALDCASRVVLEPIMLLDVNTPAATSGNVIADLAARKARISSVESLAEGFTHIVAHVPLAELFGYASSLRSLSAGRGEAVAEPAEYAPRATL